MRQSHHKSVLLQEILGVFRDYELSTFVDGTLGAGGHAKAMLQEHPEIESFIGIDQDPLALQIAQKTLEEWEGKVQFIHGNFVDFEGEEVDGILLDLGVSSMQFDREEKGFSFSKEGPLDMRMDPTAELTAADVVNTWSEKELGRVFRVYGEEKRWRAAARAIVGARKEAPFRTTLDLVNVLFSVLRNRKKKDIHPLTLVFQALRICVNRELERLQEALPRLIRCLRKGGRLAIISFHSLEDRIVKNAFRYAASDKENTSGIAGVFLSKKQEVKILTKKPIIPTEEERWGNPRSRSAKLRVIEKL